MSDHDLEDHDKGLSHDLPRLLSRRRALGFLGGAVGLGALAACGNDVVASAPSPAGTTAAAGSSAAGSSAAGSSAAGSSAASTGEIPEETGGPYPADGSNGVNVLTQSGIVRSDITSSFGSASGVAEGVPLTIELTVLDVANGTSTPYEGAAVYLWHCNRDGEYSLYGQSVAAENYLRGVQAGDASGKVTFTSIYPAAYDGRWPHVHFEVYESVDAATSASGKLRTTQLALPEAACQQVYATSGYEQSARNLAGASLETDNVFSDGYSLQLATVTGSVSAGYTATLTVPV